MTNYGKVLKNNNQILRMNHERNKVGLILMILTVSSLNLEFYQWYSNKQRSIINPLTTMVILLPDLTPPLLTVELIYDQFQRK